MLTLKNRRKRETETSILFAYTGKVPNYLILLKRWRKSQSLSLRTSVSLTYFTFLLDLDNSSSTNYRDFHDPEPKSIKIVEYRYLIKIITKTTLLYLPVVMKNYDLRRFSSLKQQVTNYDQSHRTLTRIVFPTDPFKSVHSPRDGHTVPCGILRVPIEDCKPSYTFYVKRILTHMYKHDVSQSILYLDSLWLLYPFFYCVKRHYSPFHISIQGRWKEVNFMSSPILVRSFVKKSRLVLFSSTKISVKEKTNAREQRTFLYVIHARLT